MSYSIEAGLTIPGDCREISNGDKMPLKIKIKKQISIINMPDKISNYRQIEIAKKNLINRILLSPVAMDRLDNSSWNEDIVDRFFYKTINDECIFWIRQKKEDFNPICIGPYSNNNRRWLGKYSILHNMPAVGFTSADAQVSLISDIDCDYTIIVGSNERIKQFDEMCGGKQALCSDLLAGLKANDDHYGDKNPFAFMSIYFPSLAGCD